jgi:hypothetical protein
MQRSGGLPFKASLGELVHETLSQKNPKTKKQNKTKNHNKIGLVEWCK